jgi:acetyl esterase
MPVNSSDTAFFEHAAKIMSKAMANISGAPTIDDIRGTVKHFKKYLSEETLLPFEELLITSSHAEHTIRARFISKGNQTKPVIIFFPGTAFMHYMFDENYTVLSRMMKHIDAHGLMFEYRLSPENPYLAPHEDASDALQYVLDNLEALNIDSNKIVISGYSSGANMAAVLCNSLHDNSNFKPFHQYLLSGGYDYTDSFHDYDDYVNEDKMLDKDAQQMSFDMYCQNANRKDPNCSPYWQNDFSILCPTTIQCGEYDGGRNQSEGYAKKLSDHNVDVTKIIVPGQSHLAIIYRGACSEGEDPAIIAANRINALLQGERKVR